MLTCASLSGAVGRIYHVSHSGTRARKLSTLASRLLSCHIQRTLTFCYGTRSDHVSKLCLRVIRQPLTSIHALDDDTLLHIYHLCRPDVFEDDEYGDIWLGDVFGERWWYKPVQVCRRWRYLILGCAHYLRLSLLCTRGTPVADMLMHSPPLPLVIYYDDINNDLAAEDEEGMVLALQNRNRVRRIALQMPVPSLQKIVMAIDGEFPTLEFLSIKPPVKHNAHISLPPTFEAPQLRHLWLFYFTNPIGSPFLTSAVGLVTLFLPSSRTSTYVQPELFLRSISLLHHLEQLEIGFICVVPNREIESQLPHTPITIQATLPNLRGFTFYGISAYLETLLPHMTTPLLQVLSLHFLNQLSFSVPRLLQFMITTERLRFTCASLLFYHEGVFVILDNPLAETGPARLAHFQANITCRHLDWQVSSITRILSNLRPLLSSVADLILDYREHTLSSDLHNEVDPTLWHEFLGSFRNVETLHVHKGLVGEVSRSLQLDGQSPLELLPELRQLVCPTGSVEDKSFAPFIHDRDVAGQPVNVVGKTFPVGRENYKFYTSTGMIQIAGDPDPLP
jgi:hypothetical protein